MVQLVRVWSSNLPRHLSNISSSSEILCRHAYGEAETHSAQLLRAPLVSLGWGANLAEHCTKTQMVLTCLTEKGGMTSIYANPNAENDQRWDLLSTMF